MSYFSVRSVGNAGPISNVDQTERLSEGWVLRRRYGSFGWTLGSGLAPRSAEIEETNDFGAEWVTAFGTL